VDKLIYSAINGAIMFGACSMEGTPRDLAFPLIVLAILMGHAEGGNQ
jgi:hypothetical protein